MKRVYNFSPGPSMLPREVLLELQEEGLDWHHAGMSVMEVSHRSAAFEALAQDMEKTFRTLLNIPERYHVLFMQGGATAQFSAIPLNLLSDSGVANYIQTGSWSEKSIAEAKRYGTIQVAAQGEPPRYTSIPEQTTWKLDPKAQYLYYASNETIEGVQFHTIPETIASMPLVCDMSSDILSRPVDIERFGIIFAGAQKNMGAAGVTAVIIRDDLVGRAHPLTPGVLNYKNFVETNSLYNTPATLSWYLMSSVLKWVVKQGGLEALAKMNQTKANILYHAIDHSGFYKNFVEPAYRSWMNITFVLPDPALDAIFLKEAESVGLTNLKGHRVIGGMRASLYNAMPIAGVEALAQFMHDFAGHHRMM